MNKLCDYIIYSINNSENNITYYIKQSQLDLISYDPSNNFEIVDYVCDSIHDFFNIYTYDIIIDYNQPLITFIHENYKCDINSRYLFDGSLYWILTISIL